MGRKANHFCCTIDQKVAHILFYFIYFGCLLPLLVTPLPTLINIHYWLSMRSRWLDFGHILFLHFYWQGQSQHNKNQEWLVYLESQKKKKLNSVYNTINPWESFMFSLLFLFFPFLQIKHCHSQNIMNF